MTSIARRELLRSAGAMLAVAAACTACSSGDDEADAPEPSRRTDGGPERRPSDVALLNTALSLEVLVFDTYQAGTDSGFAQTDRVLAAVRLLQQHHAEHRDALVALVEAAEGEPFTTANPVVKAGLVDPTLLSVTAERDFVQLARDLEQSCAQLYVHLASSVTAPELRTTATSFGAAASRRATVLGLIGDLGGERTAFVPAENPLPSDAVVRD